MKCLHCGKRINPAKLLGAKGGAAGTGKAKARTSEQASAAAKAMWAARRAATGSMENHRRA
jgi:hypothetical protein